MKRYLNTKARHHQILSKLEAGVVLTGAEVKSIKTRGIQLGGGFVQINNGEVFLINAIIAPYLCARQPNYDPGASRKLLLKEKEIAWLISQKKKKLTIIPLACYTRHGWIKIQLGIGRIKRKVDKKRELIAKQEKREIRRG